MNRLKELRDKKDLTQEQVAKAINIPTNTYRNYEKPGHSIPEKNIILLAKFFHTTTDYVLGTEENHHIDLTQITQDKREIINLLKYLNEKEIYYVKGYIDKLIENKKSIIEIKRGEI